MRTNVTFHPRVEAQRFRWTTSGTPGSHGNNFRGESGGTDNLTTAIDSYPEYPKIKRTRTRGLPPPPEVLPGSDWPAFGNLKRHECKFVQLPGGDLVADRPG